MKIKTIILLLSISVLLISCEDIIEVKLSDETVDLYAIEAKITSEDNPSVFVYKSQRVDADDPYQGISGASVIISDNGQPKKTVTLKESQQKKGLYVPEAGTYYLGEPGKEYTLEININGVKIISTEMLARVEPIDSIQVRPSIRGDYMFLGILTYGNEPPELGNYYKWDIYINNKLLSQSDYLVVTGDELVNGNYISGFEIFTDFHDPNKPEERKLNLGDTILVKQMSISKFDYSFYSQMFNQGQTGGLFSVPPANIESNFTSSDGRKVLGIFTAHDVSNSNVVVIDETIEGQLKK
jgi:hypothetical protein